MTEPREEMEFDVVIVGAGPAGLSAAIRLKQISPDLSVLIVEKGAEVGSHVISGAVIDPSGLDALVPDWRERETPIKTAVTDDRFLWLTEKSAFPLPGFIMPPLMSNHGNYIVSLANVCKWLATEAEALGVDIYPGFAGAELLIEDGKVVGVATGDMGIEKSGEPGPNFARGMALKGKYVLLAEGVRGSLTKRAIAEFGLAKESDFQKYGIGFKEIWQVTDANHKPGLVQHTLGWPLQDSVGGGSYIYHLEDNQVAIGFVVHLNYKNPYLSPFDEFQRLKTHPAIKGTFEGAKRLSYGARAISEGGYQSIPQLAFPGGALVGDAAGFVNLPRIKGSHNAVLSGIVTAEHVAAALAAGRSGDTLADLDAALRAGPIGKDLHKVRNVKPLLSRFGTLLGMGLAGFDMWCNTLLGASLFGTLRHGKPDYATLEPAAQHQPIDYPKRDGVLTFDRLSSVFISGTNHEENQPPHLHVADLALQKSSELDIFAGPSTRYCPAGVYEWVDGSYVINAQNCVHCKTCDIKDPNQNIDWVPPEGGGGPNYINM
ncbi:MAG: Electron transfer flavoprotein-ubiquinone oxidoreductase [Devosia sp.]|uniref:electron transfer flavoprotein-ubiquinone oxidoreductase n=1 Tax=Devosia sp. TaxID=1871048 RepID=UPI0026222E18|nr:electron transfer flavoprotein-ubiquinone oxidoreductase [Devosia sp.]MDB5585513.1 Electron transfer flavoprotein-ubiquinone oxidoreductase [Devosia sp.]